LALSRPFLVSGVRSTTGLVGHLLLHPRPQEAHRAGVGLAARTMLWWFMVVLLRRWLIVPSDCHVVCGFLSESLLGP
jgi:hypothetical protein